MRFLFILQIELKLLLLFEVYQFEFIAFFIRVYIIKIRQIWGSPGFDRGNGNLRLQSCGDVNTKKQLTGNQRVSYALA